MGGFMRKGISLLASLLILLLAVNSTSLWFMYEHHRQRAERRSRLEAALKQLETERQKVFKDYEAALESYETKSVMHQMYHASNANLRLQSISIEEQQLIASLMAEQ